LIDRLATISDTLAYIDILTWGEIGSYCCRRQPHGGAAALAGNILAGKFECGGKIQNSKKKSKKKSNF
jgi:hypothetical protein